MVGSHHPPTRLCEWVDDLRRRIEDPHRRRCVWKQGNRASLELLIHEVYHALNPQYDETVVERHAKDMARLLWKMGLRFTEE